MTDLLDMLHELDADRTRVHMILPNMALACGRDFLSTREPTTTMTVKTTCSDCLAAHGDRDGLRAEVARQQGRQTAVTA